MEWFSVDAAERTWLCVLWEVIYILLFQALISVFVMFSTDGWMEIMYNTVDAVGVDQQVLSPSVFFLCFVSGNIFEVSWRLISLRVQMCTDWLYVASNVLIWYKLWCFFSACFLFSSQSLWGTIMSGWSPIHCPSWFWVCFSWTCSSGLWRRHSTNVKRNWDKETSKSTKTKKTLKVVKGIDIERRLYIGLRHL